MFDLDYIYAGTFKRTWKHYWFYGYVIGRRKKRSFATYFLGCIYIFNLCVVCKPDNCEYSFVNQKRYLQIDADDIVIGYTQILNVVASTALLALGKAICSNRHRLCSNFDC